MILPGTVPGTRYSTVQFQVMKALDEYLLREAPLPSVRPSVHCGRTVKGSNNYNTPAPFPITFKRLGLCQLHKFSSTRNTHNHNLGLSTSQKFDHHNIYIYPKVAQVTLIKLIYHHNYHCSSIPHPSINKH